MRWQITVSTLWLYIGANWLCLIGTDNDKMHASVSADPELPLHPASLKCGLCGNITCQCGVNNDSTHESSSG